MSHLRSPRWSLLLALLAACGPTVDGGGRPFGFGDDADDTEDTGAEGEGEGGEGEGAEGEGEGGGEGEGEPPTRSVCLDVDFTGGLQGFALLNGLVVDDAAGAGAGIALRATGSDPFLGIELPAGFSLATCGQVELTFAVDAGAQGQVFWWREGDGWYAEERSRFFPLVADGQPHTITLDLAAHPLWSGTLHGFRLDPTDAPAAVRLDRLRIVGPVVDAGEGEGEGEGGEGEGEGEGGPCPAGFVDDDVVGRCVPVGPAALVRRSEAEVCARWDSDYVWTDEWSQTPGSSDRCDPGIVPEAALDNGLRRVNLYRWLAGVEPAALAPELFEQEQACATLMAAIGTLTHAPSPDMPCSSSAASGGAGSSNIAGGGGIAGSVDMYMQDFGAHNAASLGHRRWTIGPFMNITQFGTKSGYSCMYTFGVGGGSDPGFVAWPPPGHVPAEAIAGAGDFSFESARFAPTASTTVEIAVDDGAFAPVEHRILQGNYGHYGTAIAFSPPGGFRAVWQPGRTVRVRIAGTRGGTIEYTVIFAGC